MIRFLASSLIATLLVTASSSADTKRSANVRQRTIKRPVISRLAVRRANFGFRENYYRINDIGNPAIGHPEYSNANLVAFNNTGQIVAEVLEPRRYACFLYDNGHFIDVTPVASPFCQPTSLSDADPKTGALSIVGYSRWPFSQFVIGFAATVSPQAMTFHQFVEYPSRLSAVNASGAVTGVFTNEGFQPDGVDPYALPLSTTASSQNLNLLQFACSTSCFSITENNTFFHSGELNDAGLVLGLDLRTTQLAIYKLGQPASVHVLSETPSQVDNEDINNANLVAFGYSASGSQTDGRVFIDTLATRKITEVPRIAGSSCTDYRLLNLNDNGTILGTTANCAIYPDQGYFLYDPVTGTHQFSPTISESTPLTDFRFFAVNNRGQILFSAYNPSKKQFHWGTLDPLATPKPLPPRR